MDINHNALAELAESMGDDYSGYTASVKILSKVKRIVAELAKVNVGVIRKNPSMVEGAFLNLMAECRAIAEEGDGMASENEKVYKKYRILDAKTGSEKRGKYFVLKIDAKDPAERSAVMCALATYADYHRRHGNAEYAKGVESYVK